MDKHYWLKIEIKITKQVIFVNKKSPAVRPGFRVG